MSDGGIDPGAVTYDWYAYYSEKRIVHQWFQVKLLESLPVHRILEIGPALGVPTALMATAGYEVTTLDVVPRQLLGADTHLTVDLEAADPNDLAGHDCILCSEVLEHFPFETSCEILKRFAASGVPYLVMSVPYQAFQLNFSLYFNRFTLRSRTSLHYRNRFRRFKPQAKGLHQWEIGYKGYPLRRLTRAVEDAGWRIVERQFTGGTRSVFLVAKNGLPDRN